MLIRERFEARHSIFLQPQLSIRFYSLSVFNLCHLNGTTVHDFKNFRLSSICKTGLSFVLWGPTP